MSEDHQLSLQFQSSANKSKSFDRSSKVVNTKSENVSLISAKSGHRESSKSHESSKNHESSNRPGSSNSSGNSRVSVKKDQSVDWSCYYCKEPGHGISKCPKLKDVECHKCHNKGHIAKHCKNPPSNDANVSYVACMGLTSLMSVPKKVSVDRDSWVLDSACNQHSCNNKSVFEPDSLKSVKAEVLVGNSNKVPVNLVGTVIAKSDSCNLKFIDVLYNPASPANLISLVRLLKRGWVVRELTLTRMLLIKDCFQIEAVRNSNDLWVIPIELLRKSTRESSTAPIIDNVSFVCVSLTDWHRCFAHQNLRYTKEHLDRLGIKYENVSSDNLKCVSCVKGKICRSSHHASLSIAKEVGELTHVDLLTSPVKSLGGSKYALVFKDDLSKYRTVYFLKGKTNTKKLFADYFNRIETQTGRKPRRVRSDNGTEEINVGINELCSERGIIHETTCPFTPEQNGRAEREMRVLSEAVTTILTDSKLGKTYWAEAMAYAAFTINRVGKSSIFRKTPFEVFYDKPPFDVRLLRPFGSNVIVQIPKQKRKKFDVKGEEGIFVGYPTDTKGYKVMTNGNVVRVSCDVQFLGFEPEPIDDNEDVDDPETVVEEIDLNWDTEDETERIVSLMNIRVPGRVSEIDLMTPDERIFWGLAVQRELESMKRYDVWSVVPYLDQKLVNTRWVFRVKDGDDGPVGKARLVVRGFQTSNYGDTYAPVANITSIRVFLSVAVYRKMLIWQVDVETAFLNGELKEEIYLKPPDGLDISEGSVLRLNKALYELKQAPRSWHSTVDKVLKENGFRQSRAELCLYVKNHDLFLILYVDDILIAGSNESLNREVIDLLRNSFEIKLTENPKRFIGLSLNVRNEKIEIDQCAYVDGCIKRYGLEDSKETKTPMEKGLNLGKTNSNSSLCVLKFQKMLGSINYVMERTRPDVNYAVNVLSRKTNVANEEHYRYLQRVLRYLKGTRTTKLIYDSKEDAAPLEGYSDASWASEEDKKSTTGFVIRVYGNMVSFKSKKQSLVAVSTAEAEYIALSETAREMMWIRNILRELDITVGSSILYCDNQASLKIAEGQGNYNRTRHVSLKFHHVRDLVHKNLIDLVYVSSDHNLADFLTKSLTLDKIKVAMANLGFTGFDFY